MHKARAGAEGGGVLMANPEHVALVRQGAEAISTWRETPPFKQLNLHRADLRGADLRGANLRAADLTRGICAGQS